MRRVEFSVSDLLLGKDKGCSVLNAQYQRIYEGMTLIYPLASASHFFYSSSPPTPCKTYCSTCCTSINDGVPKESPRYLVNNSLPSPSKIRLTATYKVPAITRSRLRTQPNTTQHRPFPPVHQQGQQIPGTFSNHDSILSLLCSLIIQRSTSCVSVFPSSVRINADILL
ncbi:hypothetical protein K504DRAFT_179853 [Pleomassaria siparia CBS 279.74]|uniref:Uncharacterized protein n=1 Tax=Pleomassaria siparia CBS 279.74 TaxID=1314801 RepID=A0A6G1JTG5_9PLEO|nr:hypothetical protein K504DRAFT_179853 [Pleomassaria siparia CBS 279.74]